MAGREGHRHQFQRRRHTALECLLVRDIQGHAVQPVPSASAISREEDPAPLQDHLPGSEGREETAEGRRGGRGKGESGMSGDFILPEDLTPEVYAARFPEHAKAKVVDEKSQIISNFTAVSYTHLRAHETRHDL